MGQKLVEYYNETMKIGGLTAQVRLAVLTMISSAQASEVPDSPENLKVFREAMETIKKEFAK